MHPTYWCFWTVVLEKTLESPLNCKDIQLAHPKDQSWVFIGRTDVEAETPNRLAPWCKKLTHLKRPWCWERLKVGGKGDDRGWDGWMASLTQWTWVWVNSRSWWWTRRPGVLQFMGSQCQTQLSNWTEMNLMWIKHYLSDKFSAQFTLQLLRGCWAQGSRRLLNQTYPPNRVYDEGMREGTWSRWVFLIVGVQWSWSSSYWGLTPFWLFLAHLWVGLPEFIFWETPNLGLSLNLI